MTQRLVAETPTGQVRSVGPAHLAAIVARMARDGRRWTGLVRYDQASRWYRRLECADTYEIWLLSWLPGQQTGFHDHGASAGAFAVALGSLSERGVQGARPRQSPRLIAAGGVRAFGPDYVHDVRNDANRPAVSIHAYSPPLASMRRFEVSASGLLRADGEERWW